MDIRPFARHDRDQLRQLASTHAAAAIPGASLPSATLLTQLERPLGEYIIGPWVTELATVVAIQRDRLVAAAHLRRYADDERASDSYRNTGEVVWLLCWPDHLDAGRRVRDAALAQLVEWQTVSWHGDGTLPAPGVYGVSDAWPHVQALYREAGFDPTAGQTEVVFAGTVEDWPEPGAVPVRGVALQRQVGPLGTAFNAVLDDEVVGSFEIDTDLGRGGANLAHAGWAEECNHWVRGDLRGRSLGTWLAGHAAQWMRLAGIRRFLACAIEDGHVDAWTRYYARYGLTPINRTTRGWRRDP